MSQIGSHLEHPLADVVGPPRERRVRHLVRDTVALMVFSAAASVAVAGVMAGGLVLIVSLGR